MTGFDPSLAREWSQKTDLEPAARAGLEAFVHASFLEAAIALIPTLDRAGATNGLKYETLEIHIAEALLRAGLFLPAAERYLAIIKKGPEHPYTLAAIQGLLVVHALTFDPEVPEEIDRQLSIDTSKLSPGVLGRYQFVLGSRDLARRRFPESLNAFEAVPQGTADKSQAEIAEADLREILSRRAQSAPPTELEAAAQKLEQSLTLPSRAAQAKQMSCELRRETDVTNDDVPAGPVHDALLVSVEKHRRFTQP
jgi:hypothetical protein